MTDHKSTPNPMNPMSGKPNGPSAEKRIFIDHLLATLPALNERPRSFYEERISDQLLSPFVLKLPAKTLARIRDSVQAFEELRGRLKTQGPFLAELKERGLADPGNHSITMSYDFHLDESGGLKLIEVNTNASFLFLGTEMYASRGLTNPAGFDRESLRRDVLDELSALGKSPSPPSVAIVDDKPEEQRLFIEFVVAQAWLRSYGWNAEIKDVREALHGSRPDFVYNRSTDFFLERPETAELRAAFLTRTACISPNPHEYLLLADKQRLIEWAKPGALEGLGLKPATLALLREILPGALDLGSSSAEELWTRRKQLFFKPKREFGSKRAFKGASVSRKIFDELMQDDPIAQEYVPAPEVEFVTPEGPQKFKFDLRCHAYQDRLEGVVARLYQGQVTNLKTPYGGFAPVVFE